MKAPPFDPTAYKLLHDGTLTLAEVEANGIRIDVPYLDRAIAKTERKYKSLRERMKTSKIMKTWQNRFRSKTNPNSREQLGKILFEDLGFKKPELTEGKRYKTNKETLNKIKHPFVRLFLRAEKTKKGLDFIRNIRRQTINGYLHPTFSLNIARTYRSSSQDPNFQNMPVRDKWMKKLVRRCIVARKRHRIVELDYKQVEVFNACYYHQDRNMIKFLTDKTKDMHRESAMECYMLTEKEMGDKHGEMTKKLRYNAKNKFVFPQFYGSWWMDCAKALWDASKDCTTADGTPLRDHLRKRGIKRLGDQDRENPDPQPGTFEHHIQKVEINFWRKKFPTYAKWKKKFYSAYLKKAWVKSKNGFFFQGYMKRNDVINYPVQGPAFHCLLWSLIQLQRELRKRGMKALVIGQVHDSIIADVPKREVREFIRLATEIMTVRIQKHWKWITLPLEVEIEVSPVGGSWVDKTEWKEEPKKKRKKAA